MTACYLKQDRKTPTVKRNANFNGQYKTCAYFWGLLCFFVVVFFVCFCLVFLFVCLFCFLFCFCFCFFKAINHRDVNKDQSRLPSWAPVPNKPTVSVDVKQHFKQKDKRTVSRRFVALKMGLTFKKKIKGGGGCAQFALFIRESGFITSRINHTKSHKDKISRSSHVRIVTINISH